jgi:oligoendopeptidase F
MADAPTLAAEFGFDLRTPAFWRSALDTVRENINRFVALAQSAS